MNYVEIIFWSSIVSFVFIDILTQPGEIFEIYNRLAKKLFLRKTIEHIPPPKSVQELNPGASGSTVVTYHDTFAYKVLAECSKCFAGQLSLWLYVCMYWGKINVFELIICSFASVFLTYMMAAWLKK